MGFEHSISGNLKGPNSEQREFMILYNCEQIHKICVNKKID